MLESKKKDKKGRIYTEWVFTEKSYALEVELDYLLTSRPENPLKIFIGNEIVYDSVDYFYNLKPIKTPIIAKKYDLIDAPLMLWD